MNVISIVVFAIGLLAVSGVPGCLLPPRSALGQRVATGLMTAGSLTGLAGLAFMLCGLPSTCSLDMAWGIPQSRFAVAVDPLSALFLVPVFVVPPLGSVYGLGYWKQTEHPSNGSRLGFFTGCSPGRWRWSSLPETGCFF